jgi:hypothetical protein
MLPVDGELVPCIRNKAGEKVRHLPDCGGLRERTKKLLKRVFRQKLRKYRHG